MIKALITAGGRATRLRPVTQSINKHLIPLVDRPMLVHAIEKIKECGITDIAININSGDAELPETIGDGSSWGVRITYIEQKGGPKGLAHIIHNARDWIGNDSCLFYLGDNIILSSICPLLDTFLEQDLDCLLAIAHVSDPERFGVPVLQNDRIIRVLEKPQNPPNSFAVAGIYFYKPVILDAVQNLQPSERGEYEISDAHTWLIHRGYRVGYKEITGWWKDTGQPIDLIEGNSLLLDQLQRTSIAPDASIDSSVQIEGTVLIGSGSRIEKGTRLIGPVSIGANCKISESIIGPHVSIGNSVHIKHMRIEQSLIMENSSLEDGPAMKCSIIGRGVRATAPNKDVSDDGATCRYLLGDKTQLTWIPDSVPSTND